jgi:hypothetical protein
VPGALKTAWEGWSPLVAGQPLSIDVDLTGDPPGPHWEFEPTRAGFRLRSEGQGYAEFKAESLQLAIRAPRESWERLIHTALLTALDFAFYTPLHAACVVRGQLGMLLCGDSGAGKSTLSYACAREGWTLVADDSVHILPGSISTVAGVPAKIHLRERAKSLFPELGGMSPSRAPNGKQAIEILPTALGLRVANTATVGRAFFLARRPGPAHVSTLDPEIAVKYFSKYLWQTQSSPGLHEQRIRSLVGETGAHLLEYQHAMDAVEAMERFDREGVAA